MPQSTRSGIESGDAGIFVTFDKGRDAKCLAEMKDLLSQVRGARSTVPLGNGIKLTAHALEVRGRSAPSLVE